MIIFIYGTTAEAIKLAPIARRLDERGIAHQHWLTLQHTTALMQALPELGLPLPDQTIANGNGGEPLRSYRDVLMWLVQVQRWLWKNAARLRGSLPKNTVILVHGDTMTSVVGAYIARKLGVKSAHVEAGLRSGNWRHPFPEELDRRIVGSLASIHYTPSEQATKNLAGKTNIVYTHGNTVIDAVLDHHATDSAPTAKYGIVLLHRFEFISNPQLVEETMAALGDSRFPLKIMVDAYSRQAVDEAISKLGKAGLQSEPKVRHEQFISQLRSAEFIVTDSGGIQEETALLGIPTLVHRRTTERQEGMGRNAVLSGWDTAKLADFLRNYEQYKQPATKPAISPSDVVVDDLVRRGYAE